MLSYSKEREPSVEETDLNALTADVVELLEPRARERGVTLELASAFSGLGKSSVADRDAPSFLARFAI